MSDLSSSLSLLSPAGDASASAPASAAATLRVGATGIPAKEQLLLRSLLRLLDGRGGVGLQFSDDLAQCQIVFVPDGWARRLHGAAVCVHLRADSAAAGPPSPGLAVTPPLRATNVMAALEAAAALVADRADAAWCGPAALFQRLTRLTAARERRTTLLPFTDGDALCVDFTAGLVHSRLSREALLEGRYGLGEPRRPTAAEADVLKALPAMRVRELIWAIAHHLGETGVSAPELRGAYRLQRWPDAAVLSRPGYPRLVALLTSRPMSCAQAGAASAMSLDAVRWFMAASLALGIAAPAEAAEAPHPREAAPTPAQRSLLGRLRERLKLW